MNDLSNISMISVAYVNETANTTNMTRLEAEDPLGNLDVTKTPTEMFLDGCKVVMFMQMSCGLYIKRFTCNIEIYG